MCYKVLSWCDREVADHKYVGQSLKKALGTHYPLFYFSSSASNQEDLTHQGNKEKKASQKSFLKPLTSICPTACGAYKPGPVRINHSVVPEKGLSLPSANIPFTSGK